MKTKYDKPHFLCIGAQKAATTWLHKALAKHPQIWLPPVKELQHFNSLEPDDRPTIYRQRKRIAKFGAACRRALKGTKGERVNMSKLHWMANYALTERCDDEWYTNLFQPGPQQICGEITPDYSVLTPDRVAKIRLKWPDLKIIFIMREPIERALSGVKEKLGHNERRLRKMKDEDMIKMLDSLHNVARTDYRHTIEAWEAHFPKTQIKYFFLEELRADPEMFLTEVLQFLRVSLDPVRKLSRDTGRANVSPEVPISAKTRKHVAEKYRDLTYWLRDRFGGVTEKWVKNLEATINDG